MDFIHFYFGNAAARSRIGTEAQQPSNSSIAFPCVSTSARRISGADTEEFRFCSGFG